MAKTGGRYQGQPQKRTGQSAYGQPAYDYQYYTNYGSYGAYPNYGSYGGAQYGQETYPVQNGASSSSEDCRPLSEQFKFRMSNADVANKLGITTQDAARLMTQGKSTPYGQTGKFQAADGTAIDFEAKSHSIIVTQICVYQNSGTQYIYGGANPSEEEPIAGSTYYDNNPGQQVAQQGYVYYDYGVRSGQRAKRIVGNNTAKRANLRRAKNKRPKARVFPKKRVQARRQGAGKKRAGGCRCN